ncbi:MAG TPA: oligosaccharide repeat unit polymerase [Candidatus Marinimicrobia bacterium]|nr:oligosaccharide repeat unit polymerase [Candidatus Neomarinimicrobiota bacterium]
MIIFPVITILASALMARKITGTWLSPGSFFAISWSFFLIVPLLFAPEFKVDLLGIWFIAILSMACAAGSVIAYKPPSIDSLVSNEPNKKNPSHLFRPLWVLILISFGGVILLFRHALDTYNFGYYSMGWVSIPNLIAVDRYSGYINYPFIIKYSLYCIYPANLLGGLLLSMRQISLKMKVLTVVPLLLALILGIIEGARTSILLGLVLFFSAWMSGAMINGSNHNYNKSYFKMAFSGGALMITFTVFFVLIQWLRQGMDSIIVDLLIDRIRAYFFGYLAAFTQWIGTIDSSNLSGGLTTFAGPFNLLGVMERSLGFYDPANISLGISTNIFTALRGLVIDFSIPGSIFIAFIVGFFLQLSYQRGISGTIINTLPISMFYAFTLYSPLISIFHYNSILFSWIVIFFPLRFSRNESLAYNS